MASAGITALLKKMDYKDVVIAIDGSLFRYLILIFCLAVFYFGKFFLVYLRILYTVLTRELVHGYVEHVHLVKVDYKLAYNSHKATYNSSKMYLIL